MIENELLQMYAFRQAIDKDQELLSDYHKLKYMIKKRILDNPEKYVNIDAVTVYDPDEIPWNLRKYGNIPLLCVAMELI